MDVFFVLVSEGFVLDKHAPKVPANPVGEAEGILFLCG